MNPKTLTCGILTTLSLSRGHSSAQSASTPDEAAEPAKKLNNPVAAPIRVPIQTNSLIPKSQAPRILSNPEPRIPP